MDFSRTLRALRSSPLSPVDAGCLPDLFAHLEVRTRHLRQAFQQTSESLYRKSLSILTDRQKLEQRLAAHIAKNPEKIDQIVRHELRQAGLPESSSPTIVQEIANRLSEFLQRLSPEIHRASTNVISGLPETLRASLKEAHNKALGKMIAREIRVQNYKKLNFRTEDVAEGNMILGDCGAIFQVEGPKPLKTITDKSDTILAAILPIAPTRLLIGANRGYEVRPPEIRTAIARCSLEFFIASEDSDENAELANLIGLDAPLLTDEQIRNVVGEASS